MYGINARVSSLGTTQTKVSSSILLLGYSSFNKRSTVVIACSVMISFSHLFMQLFHQLCTRHFLLHTMIASVMGHSLVKEFITEDYQASVQAVLDKALDGVETANFEFPLITKAGARIEVLLNATTRRNEHGKVIGVVGIGQDITARLAQEREYSKLIDNANAPIFGVDTQGRVNVWNQCAMKLVGYSLDEVMGKVRTCLLSTSSA